MGSRTSPSGQTSKDAICFSNNCFHGILQEQVYRLLCALKHSQILKMKTKLNNFTKDRNSLLKIHGSTFSVSNLSSPHGEIDGHWQRCISQVAVCLMVLEWSDLSSLCSINMPLRSIRKMSTVLFYKLFPLTVKHFRPYLGILLTDSSSFSYIVLQFDFQAY